MPQRVPSQVQPSPQWLTNRQFDSVAQASAAASRPRSRVSGRLQAPSRYTSATLNLLSAIQKVGEAQDNACSDPWEKPASCHFPSCKREAAEPDTAKHHVLDGQATSVGWARDGWSTCQGDHLAPFQVTTRPS